MKKLTQEEFNDLYRGVCKWLQETQTFRIDFYPVTFNDLDFSDIDMKQKYFDKCLFNNCAFGDIVDGILCHSIFTDCTFKSISGHTNTDCAIFNNCKIGVENGHS